MKKVLIALLTIVTIGGTAHAQWGKSIYFEGGGPGIASFNLDARFTGHQDGIGGRIGIGGFSVDDNTTILVPMQLNYLLGKDNKNYFEIGAGATIVSYKSDDPNEDKHGTFENSFGHVYFGYRRQPANGGFLFRAGVCPIFNIGPGKSFFIPYYAGVSFGYAF